MIIVQKNNIVKYVNSLDEAEHYVAKGYEIVEKPEDSKPEFVCEICTEVFAKKAELTKHIKEKHTSGTPTGGVG